MEHALAQIAIIAGGIAAGHGLIRLGSSASHKVRSAFHRSDKSDNYNPQSYYQQTPSYSYYQPSGYHYRQ